jgi:RNA polymerase sigma-70 factor, ECF subfamily
VEPPQDRARLLPLPADRYGRHGATSDSTGGAGIFEKPWASQTGGMDNEEFLRATLPALDLVYNLARRVVPRQMDAEDLVQETYLAALGAWRDHRRPRKVEPWIATICLNLARSGYRHRARRPQEVAWEDIASVASEADPADEVMAALDRRAVHEAMWSLSEGQRVAIALVDLCGFQVAEAARVMRCPKGTVLSRLHRGRKALAGLLKEEVEERSRE